MTTETIYCDDCDRAGEKTVAEYGVEDMNGVYVEDWCQDCLDIRLDDPESYGEVTYCRLDADVWTLGSPGRAM